MLANGMGGIDWSGLDLMVEKFGVDDVEDLIERLYVIKTHDPKREEKRNSNSPAQPGPQLLGSPE